MFRSYRSDIAHNVLFFAEEFSGGIHRDSMLFHPIEILIKFDVVDRLSSWTHTSAFKFVPLGTIEMENKRSLQLYLEIVKIFSRKFRYTT